MKQVKYVPFPSISILTKVKVIVVSSGCLIVIVHLVFEGYLPGYHGDVIRPEDAVISLFSQISIPERQRKKIFEKVKTQHK